MTTRSVLRPGLPPDAYAPAFRVRLEGTDITERRNGATSSQKIRYGDVLDLSVTLDLYNPGAFSLTLNNWDPDRLDFLYDRQFDLGQEISIDLGYSEELCRVFNGKISSLAPSFPDGAAPTLTIRGNDLMRDLANRKPKDGERIRFPNATDTEVAREIARRLEVPCKIDDKPGLPRELIVMKSQTYAKFLVERANRIEYEAFFAVDQDDPDGGDRLHFVERADGRNSAPVEAFALIWGLGSGERPKVAGAQTPTDLSPNLISFSTSYSDADQVNELTVRGWDPKTKSAISYTAKDTDLAAAPSKRRAEQIAKKESNEVVHLMTVASKEEAKKLAISLLKDRRNGFAKGAGKVVGLPRLQPGKLVEIFGLGERFSGDYYVTKVEHSLGGAGFLTSFEVDRSRLRART
jgi:uncharacterized protein